MDSDDSPLSSAPDTDNELALNVPPKRAKKTTLKRKRTPSPPREATLADSPEIAYIVMFVNRFGDLFKSVPGLGCQDIEQAVISIEPSEKLEHLLCRLLTLVLNRKKPVERGHHQRALEEALQANHAQWPRSWEGINPCSGGKAFSELDIKQKLELLKILINWALYSSEAVRAILNTHYKPGRKSGDPNNPLAVQVWGTDGLQRRYYLIEGKDDTLFRVYRENAPDSKDVTWQSVASNLSELHALAAKLDLEGTQEARAFRTAIYAEIPRLEEGEKKRQKREYRAQRKAFFSQPTYAYEGRTRGKKIKYTYSSDEDSADTRSRRSLRSRKASPVPDGPIYTASGRQVRRPEGGQYGESRVNGRLGDATDLVVEGNGVSSRPTRGEAASVVNGYEFHGEDEDSSKGKGEDEEDYQATDADDESEEYSDGDADSFMARKDGSLIVTLALSKEKLRSLNQPALAAGTEGLHTEKLEETSSEDKRKEEHPESMDTKEDGLSEGTKHSEDNTEVLEKSIQPDPDSGDGTTEQNPTPKPGTGIAVT